MRRMKDFMNRGCVKGMCYMAKFRDAMKEEKGAGVVEVLLILVVIIALVVIFKTKLTTLVNNIFTSINNKAKTIY